MCNALTSLRVCNVVGSNLCQSGLRPTQHNNKCLASSAEEVKGSLEVVPAILPDLYHVRLNNITCRTLSLSAVNSIETYSFVLPDDDQNDFALQRTM